jgi:glycine/serine hydroxymethyltransferase
VLLVLYCLLVVGDRGTHKKAMQGAFGEWAHQQFPAWAQAVARGAARCASQVLDRGAKAIARGAAR